MTTRDAALVDRWPKSQSRRSGITRLTLVIVSVLTILLAWWLVTVFHSRPLRISPETTHIVEPLKSDGKQVDYFAAIEQEAYSDKIATPENGGQLLFDRVDLWNDAKPWQVEQISQKLGMDVDDRRLDVPYQEPSSFLNAYVASDEFDPAILEQVLGGEEVDEAKASGFDYEDKTDKTEVAFLLTDSLYQPWTLDDLPMMEKWLEQNSPALDLVGVAVRKPVFQIPRVRRNEQDPMTDFLILNAQEMRALARGLSVRAAFRSGTGDVDGAIEDIISCKRLGRHVGDGVVLVDLLVGIAIEGIAISRGYAGLPDQPATKDQLERMLTELNDLPPRISFERIMQFERYFGLSMLQRVAHGDWSQADEWDIFGEPMVPAYLRWLAVDWNIVMRGVNEHYDALLQSQFEPPPPSFNPLLLVSRTVRSQRMADVFGRLLLPAMDASKEAIHRSECADRMHRITLAMLRYQADHGSLPRAFTADQQGNPLHSWRVLLLPYLGQQELYAKIRLEEPWDSDHNRQFHDWMIACYQCPSVADAGAGQTTYSVVCGPEMPFDGGKARSLTEYGPDRQHLILVVERAQPVCWMEPNQEISQAAADAGILEPAESSGNQEAISEGISSPHPGGAQFGFRSGAIEFLSQTMRLEEFQRLLRGTDKLRL